MIHRSRRNDDTLTAASKRSPSPGRARDNRRHVTGEVLRRAASGYERVIERLASDANERDEGLPQQSGETKGVDECVGTPI